MTPLTGIYLRQLEVGPMANFVYLIGDSESKQALVVDPAWQMDTIFREAEKDGVEITGALVTHGHFDHCNALDELLERKSVPIYINKEEAEFVRSLGAQSGDSLFGAFPEEHLRRVASGDKVAVGRVQVTFIHTPGHTPGSQCFLVQNNLISGDTLFIRGCGRSDLPGGDPKRLYESLTQKLKKLPDETVLFPGHDYADRPSGTIGDEKAKNPYLLCDRWETFLSLVGR